MEIFYNNKPFVNNEQLTIENTKNKPIVILSPSIYMQIC